MNRIKIIGIGSPFGADKLGWHVIEELKRGFDSNSLPGIEISFHSLDRPGVSLLGLIKNDDIIIIVDAIDDKDNEGKVLRLDKSQLVMNNSYFSSHAIGVSETLALGDAIGGLPEDIVLYGLCVDSRKNVLPNKECMRNLSNSIIKEIHNFVDSLALAV